MIAKALILGTAEVSECNHSLVLEKPVPTLNAIIRLIMAITLRPTDEEQKLVDYAKDVTRQSTATKAMFDIVRDHQKVTAELQRYKKLEHEASSRARKAESTINQFQSSLTNLLNH